MLELDLGTIAFQIANFAILAVLLHFVLFRPMLRSVEARRGETERAKEEIKLEREKAAQALREEFAGLAVAAAGQIIGQKLSPEDHIDIVRKTIGEVN